MLVAHAIEKGGEEKRGQKDQASNRITVKQNGSEKNNSNWREK
jgi:hypothetical protein